VRRVLRAEGTADGTAVNGAVTADDDGAGSCARDAPANVPTTVPIPKRPSAITTAPPYRTYQDFLLSPALTGTPASVPATATGESALRFVAASAARCGAIHSSALSPQAMTNAFITA
jgi:hypothetical protein